MNKLLPIHLYNTLTRQIEHFTPSDPQNVGIYCCGPTVYNFQHIGNLRTYIFEDLLVRTLRYAGYGVQHVMNITDVGHLVSDADEGEDKMLLASRREGKSSLEIAQYYTNIFFEHCDWLNINRPDVVCKATEHISEMLDLIDQLFKRGFAYQAGGNVYFDVSKFPNYGELARLDLNQLQSGARIEVDTAKRSPLDFALWFTKSKFENQELQWDSPWGRGYPGWHIECSAMSERYLGKAIDIHCGGIDHIPVHHTNEIAQSDGACGHRVVNIWMHGGFLVTGKDNKMSKSSGEFLTLDKVREREIDPLSYRLLCLGTSYRKELAWSWEALSGADNSYAKIKSNILLWKESSIENEQIAKSEACKVYSNRFKEAVLNDLSLPSALAVFHELSNDKTLSAGEKLSLALDFDRIFGLGFDSIAATNLSIPNEITELAETRLKARRDRNWKLSDELRDKIISLGFLIEDAKDSYQIKKR